MLPVYLLGFVPISLILAYIIHATPVWIFLFSVLAIIPLAIWIKRGKANESRWTVKKSLLILVLATIGTAVEAELVSNALEATAASIGVSTFFLGIIVLAIIGNAAEYVSDVYFASQGDMEFVMPITVGSTVQVALFVAPLLVLVSYAIGKPMDLVFSSPIELISIADVAFIVNAIPKDGEVTWFKGVLLLGVYLLFAIAFLLVNPP